MVLTAPFLRSVSQEPVNIFLVCVTLCLCFTSQESVVRLGRGHSFDESTSRLFSLLSFKDNICSVAVFCKLPKIDWIKTVYLFFMHNWAFRKRQNNQSGLSRSCWFCKPTRCGLHNSKIRSLRVIWIFQITQTGIQQGDKLKSVCVYIFHSWIFDGGRVTTPNQLSSLNVGKLFNTCND